MKLRQRRIGVDLGGTKIEGVAFGEDGETLARQRIATPREYHASLDAIAALVDALENEIGGKASIGVGGPGSPNPRTGLIRNANSTWLNGKPLARDVSARLGRPVRIANDADCFALSEARDGAGAGARAVFAVILGTGVGGGLVVDGALVAGASGIAGEWGHNPLPWTTPEEAPGPRCWCGKTGCVEAWLSGPGLAADHERVTGARRTAAEIAIAAQEGDDAAAATISRYVDRLARALAVVVNIVDPDVIVLGGGVSNIDALYKEVPKQLARWTFADAIETRLLRNHHGDASGVRGAAWLWPLGADSA